jgi:outer membrane protein OmpA-like peptidoglycan-associated protein
VENPTIVVEVAGHADERGGYEYNIRLTQARANAVVDYLVKKGINPNRLIPKGYGWTQPVIKGAKTEREHQLNRRVEFRIIEELEGQ